MSFDIKKIVKDSLPIVLIIIGMFLFHPVNALADDGEQAVTETVVSEPIHTEEVVVESTASDKNSGIEEKSLEETKNTESTAGTEKVIEENRDNKENQSSTSTELTPSAPTVSSTESVSLTSATSSADLIFETQTSTSTSSSGSLVSSSTTIEGIVENNSSTTTNDLISTTTSILVSTTTSVITTTNSPTTNATSSGYISTTTVVVDANISGEDNFATTTVGLNIATTTIATTTDLLPIITEQTLENGKVVVVSSPKDENESRYVNVPVKISIPEIFRVGEENKIKINWTNNNSQDMAFVPSDEDGDGFIDHVEWIVPHLSTQTFEIILVSNALRLDSQKNILEDIYDLVKARDQNFVNILDGQYVQVRFEHFLDNTRDITLFARPTTEGSNVIVEVYTTDGTYVGTFPTINQDGKYVLVLSGLATSTDTFNLKIIGNLDIDYISDPNAFWVGGTGNWSDSNKWAASSGGVGGSFGGVPNATTNVFFDASSGSASSIVTIDSSATAGSVTINGYTGTIMQNASLTITNSGGNSGNYLQSSAVTFTATNPGTNTFSATGSFTLNAGVFRRYTGIGNSSDPFIVFDVYGLQGMKTSTSSSYKLNSNIDASVTSGWNSGTGFDPVGNSATNNFSGVFDGNNFTISSLYISTTTAGYIGLFGYSTNSIQNVTLLNVSLFATSTAGAPGSNGNSPADGTVTASLNATAGTAGTAGSTLYLGGLVGYNTGNITNVSVTGTVNGAGGAGGAGGNGGNGGNITSGSNTAGLGGASVSNAAATGGVAYVGGVIGYSQQGNITNATTSATVFGAGGAGGASGNGGNGGNGSVAGSGTGVGGAGGAVGVPGGGSAAYVGGLIGWINTGTVNASYSTGNVTGIGGVGGNAGTAGTGGNAGTGGGGANIGGIGGAGASGGAGGVVYVGGLVGNNSGTIQNGSYATGIVRAFGGVAGNASAGALSGASAAGSITTAASGATALGGTGGAGATAYAGGLVGQNNIPGFISGSIAANYATGAVTATGSAGKNGASGGAGGSAGLTTSGTGGVGGAAGNGGAGGAAYVGGITAINFGSIISTYSTTGLITALGGAGGIGGTGGAGGAKGSAFQRLRGAPSPANQGKGLGGLLCQWIFYSRGYIS